MYIIKKPITKNPYRSIECFFTQLKTRFLGRNIKEVEGGVNAAGLKDERPFSV